MLDFTITAHKYLNDGAVSQAIYTESYKSDRDKSSRVTAFYLAKVNTDVRLVFNLVGPFNNTWHVYEYSEKQRRDCLEPVPTPEIIHDFGAERINLITSNRDSRLDDYYGRNDHCGRTGYRVNSGTAEWKPRESGYNTMTGGYYSAIHGQTLHRPRNPPGKY